MGFVVWQQDSKCALKFVPYFNNSCLHGDHNSSLRTMFHEDHQVHMGLFFLLLLLFFIFFKYLSYF